MPKTTAKPTLLQRLAQAMKDHDWHKHPAEHTKADEIREHKIKALVAKCVAEHGEPTVRELWAQHVPARLPAPFGLKAAKPPKPDKGNRPLLRNPLEAFQRRSELGLPDAGGEVEAYNEYHRLLEKRVVFEYDELVRRLDEGLTTTAEIAAIFGAFHAHRIVSEVNRRRATRAIYGDGTRAPAKETYPVANTFTFKQGSYGCTDVLRKGKLCGSINPNDQKWSICMTVYKEDKPEEGEPEWEHLDIKRRFAIEPDARQWLQANGKRITRAYTLWLGEEAQEAKAPTSPVAAPAPAKGQKAKVPAEDAPTAPVAAQNGHGGESTRSRSQRLAREGKAKAKPADMDF